MPPIFWLIVVACTILLALLAVCNLGVFVLNLRAKRNPPYGRLALGVLELTVLFVLPRVLPDSLGRLLVCFGAVAGLFVWESVAWIRRRQYRSERVKVTPPIN